MENIQVLSEASKRGHEQVAYFNFPEVGLKAIVGIHSTALGPALGGCRMRLYQSESQALDDVMRLSEGMSYKNSVAGLNIGGGKSCIIADPAMSEGRQQLFEKFAECLNRLNGHYITAEDMGTSVSDIMWMKKITNFVAGVSREQGGAGDPSPWTALGVFLSMKAACKLNYNSEDLTGKKVTVQGVGHVGRYLVEHLVKAGANVTVSDTNAKLVESCVKDFGVEAVNADAIYDVPCDIYAPCAIGQTVNPQTLNRLSCKIIAGAANNQLIDSSVYSTINSKGMMYCPDFVINAGGVISCAGELEKGGWTEKWVSDKVHAIYSTTLNIMTRSKEQNKFPEVVALEVANERIQKAKKK
jgi:leucine dehydrogenase